MLQVDALFRRSLLNVEYFLINSFGNYHTTLRDRSKDSQPFNMTTPALDLSLFISGDSLQRKQLASDLFGSLSRQGYVRLVNHGISDDLVTKLFNWVGSKTYYTVGSSIS